MKEALLPIGLIGVGIASYILYQILCHVLARRTGNGYWYVHRGLYIKNNCWETTERLRWVSNRSAYDRPWLFSALYFSLCFLYFYIVLLYFYIVL